MRKRSAAETTEFNNRGYIRRGELRSTAGRAGADLRRKAIQSQWDARRELRTNGYVRRGEFRSRSTGDAEAYRKRRAVILAALEARRARRTPAPTQAPPKVERVIDTRVVQRPDDEVSFLGGRATRAFAEEYKAREDAEKREAQLERKRAEIAYWSKNRPY